VLPRGIVRFGVGLLMVWVVVNATATQSKPKAPGDLSMVTGLYGLPDPGDCRGNGCKVLHLARQGKVEFSTASGCDTPRDFAYSTGKKRPESRRTVDAGYVPYKPVKKGVFRAIYSLSRRYGYISVSCLELGHTYRVSGRGSVSDHSNGGGLDIAQVGSTKISVSSQLTRPALIRTIERICAKSGAWQMVAYRAQGLKGSIGASNHRDHVHCGFH
jgi:hypothetical protein